MKGKQLGENVTEITAIAPIIPDRMDHLREVLKRSHHAPNSPIKKISTIHYARWVILEPHHVPGLNGPQLLFTTNFDGGWQQYLEDFSNFDAGPLDAIFSNCVGWPGAVPVEGFLQYVHDHQIEAELFYAAYPTVTVREIARALAWKRKTDAFLKGLQNQQVSMWPKITQEYIHDLIRPTLDFN
jgi:hypothetical protein